MILPPQEYFIEPSLFEKPLVFRIAYVNHPMFLDVWMLYVSIFPLNILCIFLLEHNPELL